jgi:hypothetical protein
MSRSVFGLWGAELDEGRFGCALAALGVLGAAKVTKGSRASGGIGAPFDSILTQNKQNPLAPLR